MTLLMLMLSLKTIISDNNMEVKTYSTHYPTQNLNQISNSISQVDN